MMSSPEQRARAAKRRFFQDVADENQNRIFHPLVESEPRVRTGLNSATLYHFTEPLPLISEATNATSPETTPAKCPIKVVPLDSFDCAEKLTLEGKQDITVLNMANSRFPGGGYLNGASAQEEALCRRSTLWLTIRSQRKFHPIPKHGAIYSPDVLVFRVSDDKKCALLPESQRWWTSVISVAAIDGPRLTKEGDYADERERESMKERMRTMVRVAALEGRKNLVLGAFGCGAFANPPMGVARGFKAVLEEEEFKARFEGIWFAVIERGGTENYAVFKEVLDGMEI
jgi:uncharacterized protein (TIGR02452 family)